MRRAAELGHLEIVKYLVEMGTQVNACNNYAIIFAAKNGHLDIVKYLYNNGADVCAQHNRAIRYATTEGHLSIVKFLINCGAHTNYKKKLPRFALKHEHE